MADRRNTDTLAIDSHELYTWYEAAEIPRKDRLTMVIFHGAGQSTSERFKPIARSFLDKGIPVMALDFVGHGKTGGLLSDNSLAKRTAHALAAIAHWVDGDTPLILLGSSMGAHTALRVSAQLGNRVKSLCLLQPAIYASEAEDVLFTEAFTAILHRPQSWRSSLALQDAAAFTGNVYMAIGSEDQVIPWGVIEALTSAFRPSAHTYRLEVFHGAAHNLPEWIPTHGDTAQMVPFVAPGIDELPA